MGGVSALSDLVPPAPLAVQTISLSQSSAGSVLHFQNVETASVVQTAVITQ
jgi:hypothetical protein